MPGTTHFDDNGTGVILNMTGLVTGQEIIEINARIYAADPDKKLRYQIWDFTESVRMEVSPRELDIITRQDRDEAMQNPHQLVALVGSPRQLNGVDISYQIFSQNWVGDGFQSASFRTLKEAHQWIEEKLGTADSIRLQN